MADFDNDRGFGFDLIMHYPKCLVGVLLSAFLAGPGVAQVAVRPGGVTSLNMGVDVANGIQEAAPGSRVRVPPLERVNLQMPQDWPYPIQWTRDGSPIPGATEKLLTIPFATSADSGLYSVTGSPFPFVATRIQLDVVQPGHVANFSIRLELAANPAAPAIAGVVVDGTQPKLFLVRAVGPSLKVFGIANPAPRPQFKFFNVMGRELPPEIRPAVLLNWAAIFRAAGAFPLGETGDSYDYISLPPGAYTVHVKDGSNAAGTVLFEMYELPAAALQGAGFQPVVAGTPASP